jgi:hypothetical protein
MARAPKPKPRKRRRAPTIERAERALERTSEQEPTHTDDTSRDRTETKAGVIQPPKHAD